MRRLVFVFMLFISVFIFADTVKDSAVFSLSLNKSGTNKVSFTEFGDTQKEKTNIDFQFKDGEINPMQATVYESFRISWNIYSVDYASNSSAELSLTFESFTGDDEYMMRPTISSTAEINRDQPGLNYKVIISEYQSSTITDSPQGITPESSGTALASSNRIIRLFDSVLNPYSGETGYADISLELSPPSEAGYLTGQYMGQIRMNLTVN